MLTDMVKWDCTQIVQGNAVRILHVIEQGFSTIFGWCTSGGQLRNRESPQLFNKQGQWGPHTATKPEVPAAKLEVPPPLCATALYPHGFPKYPQGDVCPLVDNPCYRSRIHIL